MVPLIRRFISEGRFFAHLGFSPVSAGLVLGVVELAREALLLVGFHMRPACFLLLMVEAFAIGSVHAENGFIRGSALNLLLMGGFLSLFLSGSGRLSLKK
jgi:uncharacterized membrane protein YphA (DoxX/SURF4 family)